MNAQGKGIVEVPTDLMRVGMEVFPIYGSDEAGWSMIPEDFTSPAPRGAKYSRSELFFALVNLNITPEGMA